MADPAAELRSAIRDENETVERMAALLLDLDDDNDPGGHRRKAAQQARDAATREAAALTSRLNAITKRK